jgi:hypothetical protein
MSKKLKTPVDWLEDALYVNVVVENTNKWIINENDLVRIFATAKEMEKKYKQKLADDAFRLGWEAHKTITT